uniref:DUF3899 domain-containing protein n=1 Tax=Bursaphelenchus xylophilus TaxID=6326 RepID=A0A1I7RWB8_BURXY
MIFFSPQLSGKPMIITQRSMARYYFLMILAMFSFVYFIIHIFTTKLIKAAAFTHGFRVSLMTTGVLLLSYPIFIFCFARIWRILYSADSQSDRDFQRLLLNEGDFELAGKEDFRFYSTLLLKTRLFLIISVFSIFISLMLTCEILWVQVCILAARLDDA